MAKSSTKVEKNTDELIEKKEKQMPSKDADFSKVDYVYEKVGASIVAHAKVVLKELESTFGKTDLKPKLDDVSKMFGQLITDKKPEDYIPVLEDFKTLSPELIKAKFNYELNTHKNQNSYLKSAIKGGSDIETAKANWELAFNSYNEEKQNAKLTLEDAVYAARKAHKDVYYAKDDLESRIDYHVDYFSEASEVAAALDTYGKAMDKANASLSTAFSALLTAFIKSWNAVAAGEIKLIGDNRKDSQALWTSIQSYYSKKFSGK